MEYLMKNTCINEVKLLNITENEQLGKLHTIVTEAINEQQLIIEKLKNTPKELQLSFFMHNLLHP